MRSSSVFSLLLIAAAGWSAFWFYAASQVDVKADAWRAQEAKAGRVYDCASRTVAGYPFRLEVLEDFAELRPRNGAERGQIGTFQRKQRFFPFERKGQQARKAAGFEQGIIVLDGTHPGRGER